MCNHFKVKYRVSHRRQQRPQGPALITRHIGMSRSLLRRTVCSGSDELRAEAVQPESEQRWLDRGWAVKSINWSAKRLPRTANRAVQRASLPQLGPAARIKSRQRLTAASIEGHLKDHDARVPATNVFDDRSLLPRETSASPREFKSQHRQAHDRRAHECDLPSASSYSPLYM